MYVLSDAVTKYGTGRTDPSAQAEETPVPPCIKARAEPAGCQIAVEIEDRADKASVLKVGCFPQHTVHAVVGAHSEMHREAEPRRKPT